MIDYACFKNDNILNFDSFIDFIFNNYKDKKLIIKKIK